MQQIATLSLPPPPTPFNCGAVVTALGWEQGDLGSIPHKAHWGTDLGPVSLSHPNLPYRVVLRLKRQGGAT